MVFTRTLKQIIAPVAIVHVVLVTILHALAVRTSTQKFRDSREYAHQASMSSQIWTPDVNLLVQMATILTGVLEHVNSDTKRVPLAPMAVRITVLHAKVSLHYSQMIHAVDKRGLFPRRMAHA